MKVQAIAISSLIVGLVIAVCIACGIYFTVNDDDLNGYIVDIISDYLEYMGFTSISDWLGTDYQNQVGIFDNYLKLSPTLWSPLTALIQWAKSNNRLPDNGTISTPTELVITPQYYIPSLTVDGVTYNNYPVLPTEAVYELYMQSFPWRTANTWKSILSNFSTALVTLYYSDYLNYQFISHTFSSNGITGTFTVGLSGEYYNQWNGSTVCLTLPNTYRTIPFNVNLPAYLLIVKASNGACPVVLFPSVDGNYYACVSGLLPGTGFPFITNSVFSSSTDIGMPQYQFNNLDPIYIDLQMGNLTSTLQALQNLLTAINNNLISATIALQEASPVDLPVDTTPFIQLVSSYENVTNDYINGNTTLTSALSSMYTLLNGSITNISNPSLENACISAYNAFVNKMALFSSNGGNQSSANYQNVQLLESDLSDLKDDYISGNSTLSQILTSAATTLSTYMGYASNIQEIIGLQNAYNLFLNDLGFELDLSTNAQSVISDFNDTLDDYLDGTITREEAIGDLRTTYRNGITGSMTASDVGAITTAFQSALDQITVNELNISESIGEVSADTIALEGDLLEMLDFTQLSAYFNFEQWEFFPDTESNLYREYFQRFLATTSPFYEFLYYPLILGVAGLILGTTIRFGVKARRSRGSSVSKSGGDE